MTTFMMKASRTMVLLAMILCLSGILMAQTDLNPAMNLAQPEFVVEIDADGTEVIDINVQLVNQTNFMNSVSGMVYVHTAGPVSGNIVGLAEPFYPYNLVEDYLTTFTEADGSYSITDIPLGVYRTAVYCPMSGFAIALSQTFTMTTNLDLENIDINLYSYNSSVSGQVRDHTGQPVPFAYVEIFSAYPEGYILPLVYNIYYTITDANGYYLIDDIMGGCYHAATWSQNTPIVYYPSTLLLDEAGWFSAWGQAGPIGVDIIIPEGLTSNVSGTVTDAVTGEPLSGIVVELGYDGLNYYPQIWHESFPMPVYTAVTDDNGNYSIAAPFGSYYAFANCENGEYYTQFYDHVNSHSNATIIEISDTDISGIDFSLQPAVPEPTFSITGTIFIDNEPAIHPILVVAVSSDEDWEDAVTSSQAGIYTLQHVPAGNYTLVAYSPSSPPTYYGGALNWENAEQVTVNQDLTGIDFYLSSGGDLGPYSLNGTITDQSGNSLPHTSIIVHDNDHNVIAFARSDAQGQYGFRRLPETVTSITVTKIGYGTLQEQITIGETTIADYILMGYSNTDDQINPVLSARISNYPNPFNPQTTISFEIPKATNLRLEIFNIKGQRVSTLINNSVKAGSHKVVWNGLDDRGRAVTSGIYFIRLQSEVQSATHKIMLLK